MTGDTQHDSRHDSNDAAPVVLGNAPSSGSTLLRSILQRSPEIASGGELAILDKRDLFDLRAAAYHRAVERCLVRPRVSQLASAPQRLFARLETYAWSKEEVTDLCLGCDSHQAMLDRFFAMNCERAGANRWAEKTPGNVFCFTTVMKWQPTVRLVQIVRDGRDAVASLIRRGIDPAIAAARWYYGTLAGVQYLGTDNFCMVRYEDLVTAPQQTVRRICDHIGVPFREAMVAADEPKGAKLESWKHDASGAIRSTSVGQYRSEEAQAGLALLGHQTLSSFGATYLEQRHPDFADLTAPQLQQLLGYGMDGLRDDDAAETGRLIRQSRRRIKRLQLETLARHRRWPQCPVAFDRRCAVELPDGIEPIHPPLADPGDS